MLLKRKFSLVVNVEIEEKNIGLKEVNIVYLKDLLTHGGSILERVIKLYKMKNKKIHGFIRKNIAFF